MQCDFSEYVTRIDSDLPRARLQGTLRASPHLIITMLEPHALLTVAQTAQADATMMDRGTPGLRLMEAAGRAVAQAVIQRWSMRPVLVLCGPGNNGGDGWVVARVLRDQGWPVTVASLQPVDQLKGDALQAHRQWTGDVQHLVSNQARTLVSASALVVDALFGAGLSRPLEGVAAEVLQIANQLKRPLVAIDVPSGVWGDTGQFQGAVPCALTVTFFRLKPAHCLMPSRALCGEVVLADIGIEADAYPADRVHTWENVPALWHDTWPAPGPLAHKYDRGHAAVWGSAGMPGAARLSARAAARVGAGLTTVCVPAHAWPVYASGLDCIMVHPVAGQAENERAADWGRWLEDPRLRAVLLGPGAAGGGSLSDVRALSLAALRSGRPVVLDADALSAWQGDLPGLSQEIANHPERAVVLTPHDGEFARLFGSVTPQPHAPSRLELAREAARVTGAVVLHKGPDTVVAAPDGRACINRHTSPGLATAGAGDVLAGLIVGLLAQGMPAWEAAAAAVWMHGDAALAWGPGLIADDLPDAMPGVLRRLQNRSRH